MAFKSVFFHVVPFNIAALIVSGFLYCFLFYDLFTNQIQFNGIFVLRPIYTCLASVFRHL